MPAQRIISDASTHVLALYLDAQPAGSPYPVGRTIQGDGSLDEMKDYLFFLYHECGYSTAVERGEAEPLVYGETSFTWTGGRLVIEALPVLCTV